LNFSSISNFFGKTYQRRDSPVYYGRVSPRLHHDTNARLEKPWSAVPDFVATTSMVPTPTGGALFSVLAQTFSHVVLTNTPGGKKVDERHFVFFNHSLEIFLGQFRWRARSS
jgi:hypothetical protein